MRWLTRKNSIWIVGGAGLSCFALGTYTHNLLLASAGFAGVAFYVFSQQRRAAPASADSSSVPTSPPAVHPPQPAARPPEIPHDEDLIATMVRQGRYALLLRPQLIANLEADQVETVWDALQLRMGFVPEGDVVVGRIESRVDEVDPDDVALGNHGGTTVRVERFYLDQYPVTNRQYYEFVRGGGYEQMAVWEPEIWPGVIDFVDGSGQSGPRFWENGCFPAGKEQHPVVGVSWYEASAYARWSDRRLTTDAEWEKSASWPMQLSATGRPQRKYPWGDSMDRSRANLWGSGNNGTVAVTQFPTGVSVGGIHQLIGNVWEWTGNPFAGWSFAGSKLILPVAMKSIRGGAFDTYFDSHATCQFQSGEDPLSRKHNIGFRCAVSACDLVSREAWQELGADVASEQPADVVDVSCPTPEEVNV